MSGELAAGVSGSGRMSLARRHPKTAERRAAADGSAVPPRREVALGRRVPLTESVEETDSYQDLQ
jgi:hypothetical protein